MQTIDRRAIETVGIPRLLLIEHAGLAVANAARNLLHESNKHVVICAGMGFNGADALAAARHLHQWGYSLEVFLAGRPKDLREEPAIYANILQHLGLTIHEVATAESLSVVKEKIAGCGLIIDGLLGIGSKGKIREPIAWLIKQLNASGKPILAVDVPSGLDADTGKPQETAIKAAATVTFGKIKQGLIQDGASAYTGKIIVDSITFPPNLLNE